MAYPKKTVAFSDVKRIINEEFKMTLEEIGQHSSFSPIQKVIKKSIRDLRNNILGKIGEMS